MHLRFILLFTAAALVAGCHNQDEKKAVADTTSADGFFSTPSLDDKRVGKVLPLRGSEDSSQLLRYSPPVPATSSADTAAGYYANSRFDWVLPLQLRQPLGQHQLRRLFTPAWRQAHYSPEVYGRSARTGRWTYALAAPDADSMFTALAVSLPLFNNHTQKPPRYSAADLQALQRATGALAARLGTQVGAPSLPIATAAQKASELARFVTANDQAAVIILKADSVFAGRAAWDALLSVGLRWGNEDLFHWDNPVPAVSGDYLVDVSTSTDPGYFLPEEVAAGRMSPVDLQFSFSIPRTAAPGQVLASMHRAATYCQRRLGGHLLTWDGRPFDLAAEQQKCRAVEANLRTQHLQAGVGDALYLF